MKKTRVIKNSCGSRDGSCSRLYVLPYGRVRRNRRSKQTVRAVQKATI